MAEVRLSDVRIGFAYSVDITFPAGFLDVGDGVRMSLRRWAGEAVPVVMADVRTGDTVNLSLTPEQTSTMKPGTYIGEAVVYNGADETVLTNNRYLLDCDYSPSGA